MIRHYGSIAALAADYRSKGKSTGYSGNANSWYGGESLEDTLRFAASGDTRLVPKAEAVLSSLDTVIETPRRAWHRSPSGAFCIVPDVLAGLPTPMRRQIHVPDERAPITILITTTSSAGISAAILASRGTTILALVMALTRVRPVSLRIMSLLDGHRDGTGETVVTAEINTTPLDLASACYVLTSAGFDRHVLHGLSKKLNDFGGGWPRGFKYDAPEKYLADIGPRMGFDPSHTLVIAPAQLNDVLLIDPVAWVNAQVARFAFTQEEETIG
jgi:hypothetical protein